MNLYVADVNVVGCEAVDCDAADDENVVTAALLAGRDIKPDELLPLQDVVTKVAARINAAAAPAFLIIRHTLSDEPADGRER